MIRLFPILLPFLTCAILSHLVINAQVARSDTSGQVHKKVNMDFDQVDLNVFIKFISNLTGKNFVVDDKVRGKVTVLSPKPLTLDEAYKVFQSVLEVHGFTTVPSGDVIKIVRAVDSRHKDVPFPATMSPAASDEVVTRILPLQHAPAGEVRKILVPMVSKQGLVVAYDPTQTIILIDYASNVRRISRIVNSIDVASYEGRIARIQLEHASADSVSQKLTTLLASEHKAKQTMHQGSFGFVPDKRTNAIIIYADTQSTQRIKELIDSFDQPTPQNLSNIQVVDLENAQAVDMAQVLSELAGSVTGDEESPTVLSKDVSIVADKASNSLVIVAEPKEFETLMPIIRKLDAPRKQVFVEAAIIEVSRDASLDLGIAWQVAGEAGDQEALFLGTTGGGVGQDVTEVLDRLGSKGLSLGTLSFPFTFQGREYYSLGAFITASEQDNAVHIISTPQLMTLENEEATVVIAENRPFITSREESDADNDYTNFEYKDVGVTLKVTPLINNKGWIKLNLYQEVSRVDPTQIRGDLTETTPVTRKRTTETTVAVKDGETVVISGLMENKTSNTESQVPLLGDIPILGHLFKARNDTKAKTNLMVFITPKVVADNEDAQALAYTKSRDMNRFRFEGEERFPALLSPFMTYGILQGEK